VVLPELQRQGMRGELLHSHNLDDLEGAGSRIENHQNEGKREGGQAHFYSTGRSIAEVG
jgi:hypothetical protein